MEARVISPLLLLVAALVAPPPEATAGATKLPANEQALFDKLRVHIEAVDRSLEGVLGVSVKDLRTGASIQIRGDEVFPTASSIKAAVLYELYRQAEEGKIDLGEVTRPPLPRVGGGGVLEALGPQVSLTWRDLAVLMFGWSDNEATNVLTRRLGLEAINRRLLSLGFSQTHMRRLMMDLGAARRGDENVSTPAELQRLMEIVYGGTGLSPARASDLRSVAAVHKWGTAWIPASPFRQPLPDTLEVLDKSGDLEGVRCVTAVVPLPGRPYAASIMTSYLRRGADGEAAIREISAALYETFDRLARSSEYGRVISGQ
jgi:beta-lactamase class A